MASSRISPRPPKGPVDQVGDLFESVKQYAIQETLAPAKGAIRWVGIGSVASLSLGLALVFSTLGILRLSQDLGGTILDGSWSFLHYLITLCVVAILVMVIFSRVSRQSLAKDS
jgi:cytochrome c biogenesis protein CcdA